MNKEKFSIVVEHLKKIYPAGAISIVGAICMVINNLLYPFVAVKNPNNKKFEIHYMDVGHGDSALIICNDKAMLIDAGRSGKGKSIREYLSQRGINKLSYIIASHEHVDHIGGFKDVLDYVDVEKTYCPVSHSTDNKEFKNFVDALKNKKCRTITIPDPGDEFRLGDADIKILAVNKNVYNGVDAKNSNTSKTIDNANTKKINTASADKNNKSIVLKIVYKNTKFLFTGDAQEKIEHDLVKANNNLYSTVLKVGHHGSNTSTTQEFLDKVRPKYAIISVRAKDDKHPSKEVKQRLIDSNVIIYRTDIEGTIVCKSDGDNVNMPPKKETAECNVIGMASQNVEQNNSYKFEHCYYVRNNRRKEDKLYYTWTRDKIVA